MQAYTGSHSESFNDSDFIDESMTNVTGLTTGEVSLPQQDFVLTGSEWFSEQGGADVLVEGDIAYVMGIDDGLYLFDISNVSDPEYLSMEDTGLSNWVSGTLAYEDSIIYFPAQGSLDIINVTDSENPQLITSLEFDSGVYSSVKDVYVQNGIAFVAALGDGLVILNVTNPATPKSIANFTGSWGHCVYVVDNYAYVSDGNSFHIVNITDIHNPTQVSYIDYMGSGASSFVVHNDYLISSVGIFDVSNVSELVRISDFGRTGKLDIQSNILFSTQLGHYLSIFDFSDPENLQILYNGPLCNGIKVVGDYLVTVSNENELNIYRYRDVTEYWNLYKPYAEAQSETIVTINPDVFDGLITDVTLTVNATTPTNTEITYYASARNGAFWNEVIPGVQTSIDPSGENLKWRVEMSTTDPYTTPSIRSLNISYSVLLRPPYAEDPAASSTVNNSYLSFRWEEMRGAESYILQIDTAQTFDSENLISEVVDYDEWRESYYHPGTLSYFVNEPFADGDWYWRVAGIDYEGQIGEFSPLCPFSIDTGSGSNTTTSGLDLAALAPYILVAGGAIVLVALVVILKKRGT